MALTIDDIGTWAAAVAVEADLALEYAESFKANLMMIKLHGYMLALALRNLIRAVEAATRDADVARDGERSEALREARARFDAEVPNAVTFRDVVQYLDDYTRGLGKDPAVRNVAVHLERSSLGTVRLHVADGLDLDVRRAADAAQELAAEVSEIARGK